tara:strand:- start:1391 stop:1684 length:294 start_codon:yes stop_codon:yes gene_type:complete
MIRFDDISNLKINLNRHTELLEACEWDEKHASEALSILEECLAEIQASVPIIGSYDEFEKLLALKLLSKLEEAQSLVLIKILKDSLEVTHVEKPGNN